MRLVSSQKNTCLSPMKLVARERIGGGQAPPTSEMTVLMAT